MREWDGKGEITVCNINKQERHTHEEIFLNRTSYTCDVLQSRSLILSLMSFINDVML